MGLHNPNRIRKAQDLCKSNWNRRAYLKDPLSSYLNKEVGKKKTLTLESFIRFSF